MDLLKDLQLSSLVHFLHLKKELCELERRKNPL